MSKPKLGEFDIPVHVGNSGIAANIGDGTIGGIDRSSETFWHNPIAPDPGAALRASINRIRREHGLAVGPEPKSVQEQGPVQAAAARLNDMADVLKVTYGEAVRKMMEQNDVIYRRLNADLLKE